MYSLPSETSTPVRPEIGLSDGDEVGPRATLRWSGARVLLAPFASAWRARNVLWEMTRREVLGRYRGSLLGLLWAFSHPLLMLAIYAVVFGVIFEVKWSAADIGHAPFALVLFAGLIVYSLFAECVQRAPTLVLSYPSYVKKVVFPLDVLPWVSIAAALFHAALSLAGLVLVQTMLATFPGRALLALPLVLLPAVLFTLGIAWLLAALGVYFRDIAHTVSLFTTAVLFLSPVFYPVAAMPAPLQTLAWLNPLALVIEELRAIIFLGSTPHWLPLAAATACGLLTAAAGLHWFEKTRRGFADVV